MQGVVYKSTGLWYFVKDEYGCMWNARIKGKLKIDTEISSTNPVAVGDNVVFEIENEAEKRGTIQEVKERHNYIVRVSPRNENQKHIIASNLDLAVVLASIAEPRTSLGFIDRFLVTAEAYHIPVIIVVNKIDLLENKTHPIFERWLNIYGKIGYKIVPVVATDPKSLSDLQFLLADNTTLFSGHSGVGKTTLINCLIPQLKLKTSVISGWSRKGQHTTTFAEMYELPGGGKIIDTPGVKEFGLIDFQHEELSHFFPEMKPFIANCKYNNCLHQNEPDCAVKKEFLTGSIAEERYVSYLSMLESIKKKW